MLLELVLVAAVLALAGLAVYQANHRGSTAAVVTPSTKASSAEGLAESADAIVQSDATAEAAASASSDAEADELAASADDVNMLGDTSNVTF